MNRRTFLKVLAGGSVAVAGGGGLYLVFRPDPKPAATADPWLAAILPVDVEIALDADQRAMIDGIRSAHPDFLSQAPESRAKILQALIESDETWLGFFTELCHQAYEKHYVGAPPLPGGYPRYQEPP